MKDSLKKIGKTYVFLFFIWSGLSLSFNNFSLFFGSISCGTVILLMQRIGKITKNPYPFLLNTASLFYFPWIFKEMCIEASKVLCLILSRAPKDVSVIQKHSIKGLTHEALTLYAHSITFTPGTVTIACDEENIYVHSLGKEGLTLKSQQIFYAKLDSMYKT